MQTRRVLALALVGAVVIAGGAGRALAQTMPPDNNDCDSNQAMFTIPPLGGCVSGLLDGGTRDINSAASCANSNVDVYWYFTPSTTGTYRLATCGSSFDTVLSVHTGCPATIANQVAGGCNDDSCSLQSVIGSVMLNAGVMYRIRVAALSSNRLTGTISLELRSTTGVTGACCVPTTGACTLVGAACCTAPNTFMAGQTCTSNPCPSPVGACCNETGCTTTTLSLCGSPAGVFFGLGSACAPFLCVGNDRCATATAIPGAGGTVNGTNIGATTTPGGSGCSATSRDVWYTFRPATTGAYSLSMCETVPTWDSVIGVFTGCPGTTASVVASGCNDDGCTGHPGPSSIASVSLNAGTNYYIRVGGYGNLGDRTGAFTLTVGLTGACCDADTGACTLRLQALCGAAPNTWQAGAACGATACDPLRGACCNAGTGACEFLFPAECAANFLGAGVVCQPGTCGGGACCTDGACRFGAAAECTGGGVYQGDLTSCSPNPCPQLRACCVNGVCCEVVPTNLCFGIVRDVATCLPSPCGSIPYHDECNGALGLQLGVPEAGSNCLASDSPESPPSCQPDSHRDLWFVFVPGHTGAYSVSTCGSQYDTVVALYAGGAGPCGELTEIACNDDGEEFDGCSIASAARLRGLILTAHTVYTLRLASRGGERGGRGDFLIVVSNDLVLGSCCSVDGVCTQTDELRCGGSGGGASQFTIGGVCGFTPCEPREGFDGGCCCGANCSVLTPDGCLARGGVFAGSGSSCSPYSSVAPCCRADYNRSGAVSVQDIFDFLSGYFSASACADANDTGGGGGGGGGGISVQDIFDFLAAYFGGC